MGKPLGVYMAKPIVSAVAESYGKTHSMGKAIGVSMVKAMGQKFNFKMLGGGVMSMVSWDVMIILGVFPPYLMILIEQISWDLRKATFLANQYKEYDWNVWKQVKKSN